MTPVSVIFFVQLGLKRVLYCVPVVLVLVMVLVVVLMRVVWLRYLGETELTTSQGMTLQFFFVVFVNRCLNWLYVGALCSSANSQPRQVPTSLQ